MELYLYKYSFLFSTLILIFYLILLLVKVHFLLRNQQCKNGVTPATLSRIENGLVDFKFLTLLNLAYTLDVSLVELFENYKYQMNRDE